MSKKEGGLNPDLEKAVSDLLKDLKNLDIEDQLKIIDRAIKRSQATRAQVPQDKYYAGVNHWQSGTAVPGARLSVIDFSDRPNDYRNSPVSKPEKPFFKG